MTAVECGVSLYDRGGVLGKAKNDHFVSLLFGFAELYHDSDNLSDVLLGLSLPRQCDRHVNITDITDGQA